MVGSAGTSGINLTNYVLRFFSTGHIAHSPTPFDCLNKLLTGVPVRDKSISHMPASVLAKAMQHKYEFIIAGKLVLTDSWDK